MVRCGHSDCDKKDCPHYNEHKREVECNSGCIRCNDTYKCYTIVELRSIKIKKISKIENGN